MEGSLEIAPVELVIELAEFGPQGPKGDKGDPGLVEAPAGGVLSGTYPNPGFVQDMATQSELDALQAATNAAIAAEEASRIAADNLRVLLTDSRLTDARTPTGGAGGVLSGNYPNPGFAVDMAEQGELTAHEADTTSVHGIADTSQVILEGDSRLSNSRAPNGSAGGVLAGTYPSPSFAADMATQTELDAEAAARVAADALLIPLTQKGAASGVATLDGGSKVPASQLPALAITEAFTVVSQAAMLALTAERGDVAIRTDLSKSFILSADDPTVLANWKELLTPTDLVSSVDGRSGVVTLSDLYTPKSHEALTTTAHGGIVASTDSRLTDQRVPTDGSVTNAKVAAGAAILESKLALDVATGLLIPKALVDAKGDLLTATADNAPARLAVGANDRTLIADSAAATGLKWGPEAWTAYTPALFGVTIGNGNTTGSAYIRIGRLIMFRAIINFGTTTTVPGIIQIALPVGSFGLVAGQIKGHALDGGLAHYPMWTIPPDTSSVYLYAIKTDSTYAFLVGVSSTVPFAWGSGDQVLLSGTYEAAS